MKKVTLKAVAAVGILLFSGASAQSQSLTDIVSAATSLTGNNTVENVITSLIGTSTVSSSSITGTWVYSQPAIAFESENLLSQAGGALAASSMEKKMKTVLSKYGISSGKFSLTFNTDKTFTCTVKGKTTSGTYEINKATITFYTKLTNAKALSANIKVSGSTLQLTFTANKLLTYMNMIGNATKGASSSLSTITSLMQNYKGMQVGMKLKKK